MVSQHPDKLGRYGHCGSVDIMSSACHVISQEYETLWVGVPQGKSPEAPTGKSCSLSRDLR